MIYISQVYFSDSLNTFVLYTFDTHYERGGALVTASDPCNNIAQEADVLVVKKLDKRYFINLCILWRT